MPPSKLRVISWLNGVWLSAALLAVGGAQAAEPTDQALRGLVQQFLSCWQTNDRETFSNLLHEDVEFAYPGGRLDKASLLQVFEDYQQKKRDIKVYFWEEFFVAGDTFASAYQFAATDRATGKRQAVGTGVIGRVEDGKIILFKEYFDGEVATLQYQGKLPLDEGEVAPWPASIWLRPETID